MSMRREGSAWKALLGCAAGAFTAPSFALFCELMSAWALTTARRSIVGMVGVMDPATRGAHDAYHRLVRAGSWSLSALFCALCKLVVARLAGDGRVVVYLDDTLFHRNGPKVDGTGSWRDAVRSTRKRVVFARGLNLVVLCVRVTAPWGGIPIAIPVNIRPVSYTHLARERVFECEHFCLWRIHAKSPFTIGAEGAPRVLVCTDGAGQVEHGGGSYALARGDVMVLPAVVGTCLFRPDASVNLLEVALPQAMLKQQSEEQ